MFVSVHAVDISGYGCHLDIENDSINCSICDGEVQINDNHYKQDAYYQVDNTLLDLPLARPIVHGY